MKWPVAAQGSEQSDFCYVPAGEVVFPGPLGKECKTRGCKCHIAFIGMNNRKDTTLALVGEVPQTVQELAELDCRGFAGDEAWASLDPAKRHLLLLSRTAQFLAYEVQLDKLPVGAAVRVDARTSTLYPEDGYGYWS